MNTIETPELQLKLLISHPNFKLVNALEPTKFRLKHIPGSINIFNSKDISKKLDKENEIVIYCSDYCCKKSISLYYQLVDLGYQNVRRYAAGLTEWEKYGLPLRASALGSHVLLTR